MSSQRTGTNHPPNHPPPAPRRGCSWFPVSFPPGTPPPLRGVFLSGVLSPRAGSCLSPYPFSRFRVPGAKGATPAPGAFVRLVYSIPPPTGDVHTGCHPFGWGLYPGTIPTPLSTRGHPFPVVRSPCTPCGVMVHLQPVPGTLCPGGGLVSFPVPRHHPTPAGVVLPPGNPFQNPRRCVIRSFSVGVRLLPLPGVPAPMPGYVKFRNLTGLLGSVPGGCPFHHPPANGTGGASPPLPGGWNRERGAGCPSRRMEPGEEPVTRRCPGGTTMIPPGVPPGFFGGIGNRKGFFRRGGMPKPMEPLKIKGFRAFLGGAKNNPFLPFLYESAFIAKKQAKMPFFDQKTQK